ncbi:MAG: RnfABCDGE type electron transport complex subunit D [Gemmatimonadales bacterium]|nr:MAG: RnfABCDGE type electron transport complex subunit D [Gemmatimonadales bacterium]
MSAAGPGGTGPGGAGSAGGDGGSGRAERRLELVASPHLKAPDSTPRIMWTVVVTLVPVVVAAAWNFGPSALLVIGFATLGAMVTERWLGPGGALRDGSAAITGLLLGLTLPAGLPVWMAFAGGAVGIGFGKLIFGGLGQNVFNPALLGRAFLQAAFPAAMTTWPLPTGAELPGGGVMAWSTLRGGTFALPLLGSRVDAVTGPTPLGLMKFESVGTEVSDLFMGTISGSIGETSALLILVGGAYLALKNYLNWRIPVSVFAAVAILSSAIHAVSPAAFPGAPFMLFSGGLMLGAIYMATDMVTSPVTNVGAWIYGAGIGALVVLIRFWGGLPEGVMYAILLMNALVPFINRATQPRVFGTGKVAEASP